MWVKAEEGWSSLFSMTTWSQDNEMKRPHAYDLNVKFPEWDKCTVKSPLNVNDAFLEIDFKQNNI